MLPKFYYINLDRSEDRLKHMNKFFRKLEKKTDFKPRFQRIQAFDGGKENVDNFSNIKLQDMWLNKEQNRKAIGPEFGCCYSHIKAMHTFLNDSENTDDIAFMCEDDLELFKIEKEYFRKMMFQIIDKTNKDGIVAISCVGSPMIIEPLAANLKSPIFLDYHSHIGKLYGTGCYAINRKTAESIVKKHWEDGKLIIDKHHNSMVADHFIYPRGDRTTFMIPSIFTLRPQNDSYIHKQHLEMHDKVQICMFKMWNNFNVAKATDVAIISNNSWGSDYYIQKTKKYNTPTVNSLFSPEDYVKFIEKFDAYIKVDLQKAVLQKSDSNYPVGKLVLDNEEVVIHFIKETSWEDALKHWEERKVLLPKKSEIIFKFCDREFEGKLTEQLLDRFYKIPNIKKVVFLSDYCKFKNKFTEKKYGAKLIAEKFSDSDKKCCPEGDKLYRICGVN